MSRPLHQARHSKLLQGLLLVAALCVSANGDAEIYEYRAADGTVTYTTQPRSGPADRVIGSSSQNQTPEEIAATPRTPNSNPTREADVFDRLIHRAANAYALPFELVKAVMRVESGFDPHAVSPVGAQGLMQLMPATARSLSCSDAFDPEQNIMAGTQYLRILLDRYNGDLNLALSAYNAGPGAVQRADGIPFEETRRYVERVYGYYLAYLDA